MVICLSYPGGLKLVIGQYPTSEESPELNVDEAFGENETSLDETMRGQLDEYWGVTPGGSNNNNDMNENNDDEDENGG